MEDLYPPEPAWNFRFRVQFSVGFDVVQRYQKLAGIYETGGFANEAGWTRNLLRVNFEGRNRTSR
jgi:hypothetical protein